jgi:hypothetical protein
MASQRSADGSRERRSMTGEISPNDRLREIRPPDSKSPRPVFQCGLNSCDDVDMQVICPTCQIRYGPAERFKDATKPIEHEAQAVLGDEDWEKKK